MDNPLVYVLQTSPGMHRWTHTNKRTEPQGAYTSCKAVKDLLSVSVACLLASLLQTMGPMLVPDNISNRKAVLRPLLLTPLKHLGLEPLLSHRPTQPQHPQGDLGAMPAPGAQAGHEGAPPPGSGPFLGAGGYLLPSAHHSAVVLGPPLSLKSCIPPTPHPTLTC